MAKIAYILRATPAGTPVSGATVTVTEIGVGTLATPSTNANGIATYEADGSPGPVSASATSGSRTVVRDGRSIDQMGTWYPQDIPRVLRALGNGVIPGYTDPDIENEDMQVVPGSGLQVTVSEGVCLIDGHVYGCTADTNLTIAANASGSTRYDRVVVRFTREGQTQEGKCELAILQGTPGAGDGAALTKSDTTFEFSLAKITVVNAASSFVSGDIADERYSTALNQSYVFTNPGSFDDAATSFRAGDILYVNSTGKMTRLAKGTDGQVLQLASGVPSWASHTITVARISDLTATASELNTLDGITANVSELNTLDGITSTVTELNYTDGVTSAIQTQLDAKSATSHTHEQVASLSGSAVNDYGSPVSVGTSQVTVCNFNLGPLESGVTYDVIARGSGQGNAPSGGYIMAYVRIEAGGTPASGYGTCPSTGERTIEAFDSKAVVGAGSTINIAFRAQSSIAGGSVNGALVWALAVPRDVPAS